MAKGQSRLLPTRRKARGIGGRVLPRTLKARSRPADTTLQRHASFFDDNGDRGVDVAECTRGLKALALPIPGAIEGARTVPALSVARMKSFYDGTLFFTLAREHA
jgi:hypothetical protein